MTIPPNFAMITSPRYVYAILDVIEPLREIQSGREWDRLIAAAPKDKMEPGYLRKWREKEKS